MATTRIKFSSIAAAEAEAQQRVADSPSKYASLGDAKADVAAGHGFTSWRRMVVFLLHMRVEKEHPENDEFAFLRLACLSYTLDDGPSKFERARRMLAEDPALASRDIFHAAAVGDAERVRELLNADPDCLDRRGGFFDWPPLMYSCYSRLNLPGKSTLAAAKLLLERGADPNPYFMWGGQYKFTALTGVFGEGEAGPHNSPEHESCLQLARELLEAGADPNDGQALYDRMFGDGNECLELLLEFGLNAEHRCNWLLEENGEFVENPKQTLQYQLSWAVRHQHRKRAQLLIENGADLSTMDGNPSFYEMAMLAGQPELAEVLVQHGAERTELSSLARFASACTAADETAARALLDAEPDLMTRLQAEQDSLLNEITTSNRIDAMKLMVALGVDLNPADSVTPLHDAAWFGRLEMTKLLVDSGADVTARDPTHRATPLQWAKHNGRQEILDYLATQAIDLFDAIICDNVDRIRQLVESDPAEANRRFGDIVGAEAAGEFGWKTPLATAVLQKKPQIVELLLEHGADPNIANAEGVRLLELARSESSPEIVAMLE